VTKDRRYTQTADDFISEDLCQMRLAPRYTAWLFRLIEPFLGTRVLEIGCGIGAITEMILARADHVLGIEPNEACRRELQARLGTDRRFQCLPAPLEACDPAELAAHRVDTIVLVNVLEHIEDDGAVMRRLVAAASPGARFLLIVPAGPGAYGTIDRAVGHFRRYSRASLAALFAGAGLVPERLRYSNLPGLLGWVYNSRVRRRVRQSNGQIRLFDRLVPLLAAVERVVPPPLGMSLVGVAHKVGEATHAR
jgi:2-polyprenyl-3-methyl-5-hydroxy-6-metoxy-1,4-benzoquinol methylase